MNAERGKGAGRISEGAGQSGVELEPALWIDRHGSAMFAYARLRLPNADLADDAVQEALASAWHSRGTFGGRSSERTWLIGILRFKVLDLLAARSRHASTTGIGTDSLGDDSGEFEHGRWAARHGNRPGDASEADVRRAIEESLRLLPDLMRQALVLREVDGLPGKTVCEILGITETNLWTAVHRAKGRLRVALTERFGEDWDGSF